MSGKRLRNVLEMVMPENLINCNVRSLRPDRKCQGRDLATADLARVKVFTCRRQASKRDLDHGRPEETVAGALQPVVAWAENDASFQQVHPPATAQDP